MTSWDENGERMNVGCSFRNGETYAHGESFGSRVLPTQKPDFPSSFLPDDAGHMGTAVSAIEASYFGSGLSEPSIVRGDGQVADHMKNMTAANGVPRHHGNDGLRHPPHNDLKVEHGKARNPINADVPSMASSRLITSGAKSTVSLTRQDCHTRRHIVANVQKGPLELPQGPRSERIVNFRPADGHLCDLVGSLVANIHWRSRSIARK